MDRVDTTGTERARFGPNPDRPGRIADASSYLGLPGWWILETSPTRPRSATEAPRVPLAKPTLREAFGRSYVEPGRGTSRYRDDGRDYRRAEYEHVEGGR